MHPKAQEFYNTAQQWKEEYQLLRTMVLDCGLTEEWKWKHPCYTYKGSNILVVHGFKEYMAISFFKGALLKDTDGLLVQPTENSQASRQLRFTTPKEIAEQEATIKATIFQAIEVEKAGLQVNYKKAEEFAIPEEFEQKMQEDPALQKAFEALTPGRQKGYLLFFSGAKQAKTRAARVEKYRQRIMQGKGMNDCVCGKSKRYPMCDGSHKYI